MKHFLYLSIAILAMSCTQQTETTQTTLIEFQNEAHKSIVEMIQKAGDYDHLKKLNDVTYTYTYTMPDGIQDISTESYIFDGELSHAVYHKHERTLPQLEGEIEQGFDGTSFWLKSNNEVKTNESYLKKVKFNRKTNFYWFSMMQKLNDPGLIYEHIADTTINNDSYEIIKISFDTNKPSDIYQVYLNKKTSLIDMFLFTVVDYDMVATPFIMTMEYEKVDNILIPSKRRYTKANWNGETTPDAKWISVEWSNIKFNNNLKKSIFQQL